MEAEDLQNSTVHGNASNVQAITRSLWEVITIATMSAIVSLITIIGNILVVLSFKVNSQLKTVNNYYLLSLAFADLIIGIFSMNLYTSYILMGYWALGSLACDLWLALDYVASNASVMNLLVISFDRYFSITRPLTYRSKRTPRRAGFMIGLAWLVSLVLWAPPILCWQYFVGKRTVPLRQCQIQFFSEPVITFGTAIAAFYIPITIMIILYCRIYRETEKRTKYLAELQGNASSAHLQTIKPQRTGIRSCFSCKRSSSTNLEGNQASWSSSNPGIAPNSTQEWLRAEQMATFNSYLSLEEDERQSSSGAFQAGQMNTASEQDERHELASLNEGLYIASHPKRGLRQNKRGISYKFRLVPKNRSPRQGRNREAKKVLSSGSSAESLGHTSSSCSSQVSGPILKSQNCKRKRIVLIKEKKAAQTLSAILLAFILTWTPYNIMVLVSTFCSDCVPLSLWHLGYWLCYVNSTVNPMCYALCNKTFRKTFRMLLLCRWKRRDEERLYWGGHSLVMGSKVT
ncbi:muscarinic acetylcholine receptor M5-like [Conger conger]|uniref:muscarinic acetylcholine receptor M5-like n=1 Tax=Conger conger TaxID=82655 RepID=UPI002A5A2B70|nr:muscarinic acetylcholine receptor M5-like [Conger conger]